MARALTSPLAPSIEAYVAARRAQGYKFSREATELGRLDALASDMGWQSASLGRELVEAFASPREGERPGTTESRQSAVRGLGKWLVRRGEDAYVLPKRRLPRSDFAPVIMSEDEVRSLLSAADSMRVTPRSPHRHVVIPALLRTVYACGLRISEALHARVRDMDLGRGVLTIPAENAKFNKGRIVPVSDALLARLVEYDRAMGVRGGAAPLFPSPKGFWRTCSVDFIFLGLLSAAGIPHTDDGPTVHSLRNQELA